MIHRQSATQMIVPCPGPIDRPTGGQPKADKENQQQTDDAQQNHAQAPGTNFVKLRSIEQGHERLPSKIRHRQNRNLEAPVSTNFAIRLLG
jgi:hypothetical protein